MASGTDVMMLWETIDASSALTSRFGFSDVERAVSWVEHAVQEAWACRVDRCDRLVMSASNLLAWLTVNGRAVVAKCCIDSTRRAHLTEVDTLVAWLHAESVPVAAPIAAASGRLRIQSDRFSIGLYPVVEGDLLDVADTRQVEAAGQTLATLHQALSTYPGPFGSGSGRPDEQLIHNDFRSANILCKGGSITAVLDFDEMTRHSRIADLGRAAVLLGARYHDWQPTDPKTRSRFIAAYDDVAPLSSTERVELQRSVAAVSNHFGWA